MFILTAVDYGETCDGHARLLGTYETAADAETDRHADMLVKIAYYGEDCVVDEARGEVWAKGEVGTNGCVWDIFNSDCN